MKIAIVRSMLQIDAAAWDRLRQSARRSLQPVRLARISDGA